MKLEDKEFILKPVCIVDNKNIDTKQKKSTRKINKNHILQFFSKQKTGTYKLNTPKMFGRRKTKELYNKKLVKKQRKKASQISQKSNSVACKSQNWFDNFDDTMTEKFDQANILTDLVFFNKLIIKRLKLLLKMFCLIFWIPKIRMLTKCQIFQWKWKIKTAIFQSMMSRVFFFINSKKRNWNC